MVLPLAPLTQCTALRFLRIRSPWLTMPHRVTSLEFPYLEVLSLCGEGIPQLGVALETVIAPKLKHLQSEAVTPYPLPHFIPQSRFPELLSMDLLGWSPRTSADLLIPWLAAHSTLERISFELHESAVLWIRKLYNLLGTRRQQLGETSFDMPNLKLVQLYVRKWGDHERNCVRLLVHILHTRSQLSATFMCQNPDVVSPPLGLDELVQGLGPRWSWDAGVHFIDEYFRE